MLKEYNTNELLKMYQQDVEKNKTRIRISNIHSLFNFAIKWIVVFACIWVIILFIKEMKEYKEVFFTYNAMEQLESMYKGDFTLLYPKIDTSEKNVTPNRILLL